MQFVAYFLRLFLTLLISTNQRGPRKLHVLKSSILQGFGIIGDLCLGTSSDWLVAHSGRKMLKICFYGSLPISLISKLCVLYLSSLGTRKVGYLSFRCSRNITSGIILESLN